MVVAHLFAIYSFKSVIMQHVYTNETSGALYRNFWMMLTDPSQIMFSMGMLNSAPFIIPQAKIVSLIT